jgi:hypothetical protein
VLAYNGAVPFGAEEGIQFGEELMGRLFVHLFEVGYPLLLDHLASPFVDLRSCIRFSGSLSMESREVPQGRATFVSPTRPVVGWLWGRRDDGPPSTLPPRADRSS